MPRKNDRKSFPPRPVGSAQCRSSEKELFQVQAFKSVHIPGKCLPGVGLSPVNPPFPPQIPRVPPLSERGPVRPSAEPAACALPPSGAKSPHPIASWNGTQVVGMQARFGKAPKYSKN